MKKFMLITLLVMHFAMLSAQEMTFTEVSPTATTESMTTYYDLKVQDTVYQCVVTRTGSLKMERKNLKTGEPYWSYLVYRTEHMHGEHVVFTNKTK